MMYKNSGIFPKDALPTYLYLIISIYYHALFYTHNDFASFQKKIIYLKKNCLCKLDVI